MQNNVFIAFLIEVFQRIKAKSPKVFQWIQWIAGAATAITGIPSLLTALHVVLPAAVQAITNKTVAIAAGVAFIMSLLPVNDSSDTKKFPLTAKLNEPKQ